MAITRVHYDFSISRIIKSPPAMVWQAWVEPRYLEKWWTAAPIVTVSTKHEFYPGGGFGIIMRTEDGTEYDGEGCFLEVVENHRIVWTTALQGGWRPNSDDMPFSAIITLEHHPKGTKYTATALYRNEVDRQKHAKMGFVEGWDSRIEQLARLSEELAEQTD